MRYERIRLTASADDSRLTENVSGIDHNGEPLDTKVVVERPLTLFLNRQEIVTMMTICDYPDYLAVGYLINQNMLDPNEEITGIDYEEDIETVVVRTEAQTDFEDKLKKDAHVRLCARDSIR